LAARRYRYYTADVFTQKPFGGNQLAVIPHAEGLDSSEMQAIAREFNYSETTFVLPPRNPANTRRLRIFTPGGEVPFAGHPTVGTAFVLAASGEVTLDGDTILVLEEEVGPVPVLVRQEPSGTPGFCQLSVAQLPRSGPPLPPAAVLAEVLSLQEADLAFDSYPAEIVSCGLPFALIALSGIDAVRRARIRFDAWQRHLAGTPGEMVMVFALEAAEPGHDVHARMFAPGIAVPEDPATGSACASLGGYLGARLPLRDGKLRWTVEQGYEIGRPSLIEIEVEKAHGAIRAVRVGGYSILVCEGLLTLP
jgi:trans-2,3-dihydro-3-hydroxyanthranilate isomerase